MANTKNAGSISAFKSQLAFGGARPNLFMATVNFPGLGIQGEEGEDAPSSYPGWTNDLQNNFKFMCKAAALPASNLGVIEVPFRGQTLKVAGDRTVDTWTVTVINDEHFGIRKAFEDWVNITNNINNVGGLVAPSTYMGNADVYQLSRSTTETTTENDEGEEETETGNNVLAHYKFKSIFPTAVSQIDLSFDSSDTIEEFTVEFQVQYWRRMSLAATE